MGKEMKYIQFIILVALISGCSSLQKVEPKSVKIDPISYEKNNDINKRIDDIFDRKFKTNKDSMGENIKLKAENKKNTRIKIFNMKTNDMIEEMIINQKSLIIIKQYKRLRGQEKLETFGEI
jgi:hypothetical protein